MFQIDYEPLDGSVVSIDTTLNDGFVADDLKVLRRPSFHRDETPNGSWQWKWANFDQYTKTQQQLMCKEAWCSYQTSVSGNLKNNTNAQTAMDFQPHKTTFNHIKPLVTT